MFVVAFNLNKMIFFRCFCNLNLFCLRFLILHPIFRVSFFSIKKNGSPTARPYCYYWQRNGKDGQAEVDYVVSRGNKIVPIEVKACVKGSMQSMYYFIEQKGCEYGIRTSLEPFSKYGRVQVVPLYAVRAIVVTSD